MPSLPAVPRWMLIGLVGAAVAYVAVCLALFLLQRSMIYFPQPRTAPAGTPLLTLAADGRQVLATMREHEGPRALIYFGGNAEDVSLNLPGMAAAFPDHALYLLHYPGYGGAPGRPSEAALVADALALFDQVAARHPRVSVLGRSLGSGVAIQVASAARSSGWCWSRPTTACWRLRLTGSRGFRSTGSFSTSSNPTGTRPR